MPPEPRPPRWYAVPLGVLLVTFIGTLISFALSLLLGILGTVIWSFLSRTHPDMTAAYRHFAIPATIVAGSAIFLLSVFMEVRHYRQSKALATIATQMRLPG